MWTHRRSEDFLCEIPILGRSKFVVGYLEATPSYGTRSQEKDFMEKVQERI